MTALLRLESKDCIATITLTQPERMNALNFGMLGALVEALDKVGRSDDRVLVLAAEGRAFCAGAARAEMIERQPAEWAPIVDRYLDPVRRHHSYASDWPAATCRPVTTCPGSSPSARRRR